MDMKALDAFMMKWMTTKKMMTKNLKKTRMTMTMMKKKSKKFLSLKRYHEDNGVLLLKN
uniref:Uncharacterized protein n=1 Tax=Schistosoma curassoni TaxID=6186 RepID=A0A183KJH6_9TREM